MSNFEGGKDMKKKVLFAWITIVFMALVVCETSTFAQKATIKIGVVDDFSGPLAAQGRELAEAIKIFFTEKGWEVKGRKIEVVTADTRMIPDTALTKTKKMVMEDKVHLLIGYHSSSDSLAIRNYVHSQSIPTLSAAGAVDLTRDLKSPFIFRVMSSTAQNGYPFGVYAGKKGYKRAILMGMDFVAGRQNLLSAKAGFEEQGGKVIDEGYSPLGTTDFSPYLAKITRKKGETDVLFTSYWGGEAARFFVQYSEYGLKGIIPVCGVGGVDETALPALGKNGLGIKHLYVYCATIDTPGNKKFVKTIEKEIKRMPGAFAYMGYNSARIVWDALNKINAEVENTPKFLDVLRKTDFINELTGSRLHFDKNQGMIFDHYIMEIKEVDGKVVNIVIETIPQVEDPVDKFPIEFFKK